MSSTSEKPIDGVERKEERVEEEGMEEVIGKTPEGVIFKVPPTSDVISSLFHPSYPKTHIDIVTLTILGLHILGFILLPNKISKNLFLILFIFWRLSYNVGLGYLLNLQSKKKFIVNLVNRYGLMDENKRPKVRAWIESQVITKMGKEYKFDQCPVEFNTWIFFRHLVDIILLSDFVSYCCFAWSYCRLPTGHGLFWHTLRWIAGWTMIFFNLWVKVDAHRVIHDYAWYWGDVFFQQIQSLKFDGVFELAPHPMYSIGYAGFYGLSLVVGSYTVLFVSIFAHALQFGFLLYFENPHIERTYGEEKPLAVRIPINEHNEPKEIKSNNNVNEEIILENFNQIDNTATVNKNNEYGNLNENDKKSNENNKISLHDLEHRYFSKDLLIFKNFDIFRSNDLFTVLIIFYSTMNLLFMNNLSNSTLLILNVLHAVAWRIFHSFVLGFILKAQSENKWLIKHYLKYYAHSDANEAKKCAFDAFKRVYNLSLIMVYVSYLGVGYQTYQLPIQWTVGTELLKHTIGIMLILLQTWCATETHQVIGNFGWFFGNFFLDDYPSRLEYTGIYRYVNDPERSMGGAALFGIALISGSNITLSLAVFSYLVSLLF